LSPSTPLSSNVLAQGVLLTSFAENLSSETASGTPD
jgi:hypothetical protein